LVEEVFSLRVTAADRRFPPSGAPVFRMRSRNASGSESPFRRGLPAASEKPRFRRAVSTGPRHPAPLGRGGRGGSGPADRRKKPAAPSLTGHDLLLSYVRHNAECSEYYFPLVAPCLQGVFQPRPARRRTAPAGARGGPWEPPVRPEPHPSGPPPERCADPARWNRARPVRRETHRAAPPASRKLRPPHRRSAADAQAERHRLEAVQRCTDTSTTSRTTGRTTGKADGGGRAGP